MEIQHLVTRRKELETKLVNIFCVYISKYMNSLFDDISLQYQNKSSKKVMKEFQAELIKVALWNEEKKKKKFEKFLRWVKSRFELREDDIKLHYYTLISVTQEIIKRNMTLQQHECTLEELYYRVIKRCARFFYENPSLVEDKSEYLPEIQNIIEGLLATCQVQISYIIDQLQQRKMSSKPKNENSSTDNQVTPTTISKEPSEPGPLESECSRLEYIPSENFDIDYYDEETHHNPTTQVIRRASSHLSEEENVKMITIPKFKKYNPYKSKKKET